MNIKPCNRHGCPESRMVSGSGEVLAYCPTHQREIWRKRKTPTPGKKRGPKPGTTYKKPAPTPETAPLPMPVPKAARKRKSDALPEMEVPPVPKHRGILADPALQIIVIDKANQTYRVYAVAFCTEHEFDPCRTPERVTKFYSTRGAVVVEQPGVLA